MCCVQIQHMRKDTAGKIIFGVVVVIVIGLIVLTIHDNIILTKLRNEIEVRRAARDQQIIDIRKMIDESRLSEGLQRDARISNLERKISKLEPK